MPHKMKFTNVTARARIDRIQLLLRRQPMSIHEIADGINLSLRWTYAYIDHLKESGRVRVKEVVERHSNRGKERVPLFAWGD